jgi:PAS domain S-box-containing protein
MTAPTAGGTTPPRSASGAGERPPQGEALDDALKVIHACDIVLGSITMALGAFVTVAALAGRATLGTVALVWLIPIFNMSWSALTKRRSRYVAEPIRSLVSLPIVTLIYVTADGPCHRMWLPAAVMVVGAGLLWGCLTRRSLLGQLIALAYATAILTAGHLVFGGPLWDSLKDALGVLMTGLIVSLVAAELGRSLGEARLRRDEAVGAKSSLEAALLELTSAQEQLDAVLQCAPASILAVDRGGRIEFTNKAPGMKENVIGTSVLEHVLPEGRELFTARMNAVLETGRAQTLELRGRSPEDDDVWYAYHLGAMRSGGLVVGVVVIWQDVTELKRTQVEFISAQRLAAVGTLAAGIAHEINTPIQFVNDSTVFLRDATRDLFDVVDKLQAVQRTAQALPATSDLSQAVSAAAESQESADLPYLIENVPRAFERCVDGLQRVATIVRSMKEFVHPSQKDMASVDLNRAIQSTLIIARSEYRDVADLETSFGELPPVTCYVNDVNQVVLNLVVNAAHAVADAVKGTPRRGTIAIETRLDGADAIISIRDTGAGIPESIRARIFEPFFTTKEVGRGTGQGLALVWRIINEKHRGDISFDSKPGEGTTFRVRLPISGVAAAAVN